MNLLKKMALPHGQRFRVAMALVCATVIYLGLHPWPGEAVAAGVVHGAPAPQGDDAHDGSPGKPVRTLARALALVQNAGGGEIRLAKGVYDGPVRLVDGVQVVGGYTADFATSSMSPELLRSTQRELAQHVGATVLVNTAGDRVVEASGLKGEASLSRLVIVGPDLSAKPAQSSYGVVLQGQGGRLKLDTVKVVAGTGGQGGDGVHGASATSYCTAGGEGGRAEDTEKPTLSPGRTYCVSHPGKPGASVKGATTKSGGEGGLAGETFCTEVVSRAGKRVHGDGNNGGSGRPGAPGGMDGAPGGKGGALSSTQIGAVSGVANRLSWITPTAGSGSDGDPGAGGGGGGAGGSLRVNWAFCPYVTLLGGTGGNGGAGGCGGKGGQGGQSGGGAFAIMVHNAHLQAHHLIILQGQSGAGGTGGNGGDGKKGEVGKPGQRGHDYECALIVRRPGIGGAGSKGGDGGGGGGGAGGNGGPVIGVALVGAGAHLNHTGDFVLHPGTAGIGGKGGLADGREHGSEGTGGFQAHQYRFADVP